MKTEDILIKLHRQYGKNELVLVLNNEIKELNIKNGQLLSEIDHLKYELTQVEKNYVNSIKQIRREIIPIAKKRKRR